MDTVHDQNIRKAGGKGQAVLNYISDEVYNDIAESPLIDHIAYTKAVSYRLKNPGLERWRSLIGIPIDMLAGFFVGRAFWIRIL